MSYTTDLVEGFADLLVDGALAAYRPDGPPYGPAETGIYLGVMPPDPDRAIAVNAYPVEDDDSTDAVTGLQFRLRAGRDVRQVDALADELFDLLHNRRDYRARGIYVAITWRQSQAWIGQDTHGRMEITANYYARTVRSAPHLHE
ncbi:hypothetical protein GCM10011583_12020 [Streptomyces camponoticapitis]|uniref:Tail terminator n=1 Tax=Streptomyces camponoticapitis TaxID=1616125 RepID=A0ABQ2E0G2_9ACTN|nr:minor capsid protein [Streptomyces camponoticapitis]GGJ82066.1 hypothetical protein GCM10011583_12020 [Streptomyces camponoticapitis]